MSEQFPEQGPETEISEVLAQKRLLSDIDHLNDTRLPDGSFDPVTEEGILTNKYTALHEAAMPFAVSETFQPVGEEYELVGRKRRIFRWLGMTALDVAASGKNFHVSEAAFKRVDIEEAEAIHNEVAVRPGVVQSFLSLKMTRFDASVEVAKREHLYADDAIRTTTAVTDEQGVVIGANVKSLLVRNVPLEAWLAMLQDPENIFNRSFTIRDNRTALSVMELFRDLELPEDRLPEGPVSLVAAVVPYIEHAEARESVEYQLMRFRGDQTLYDETAEAKAAEWMDFDKELAQSLYKGKATFAVKRMIITLQDQWTREDAAMIQNHMLGDCEYLMTRELAARLEKANQNILSSIAAIETGNDAVLEQMDVATAESIKNDIQYIGVLRAAGTPQAEINLLIANLHRRIANENLDVGGGCMGDIESDFANDLLDLDSDGADKNADKKNWKWGKGVCQVTTCPSPKPTEVGPCSVCRSCQHKFDIGIDPTKTPVSKETGTAGMFVTLVDELIADFRKRMDSGAVYDGPMIVEEAPRIANESNKANERVDKAAGKMALAAA